MHRENIHRGVENRRFSDRPRSNNKIDPREIQKRLQLIDLFIFPRVGVLYYMKIQYKACASCVSRPRNRIQLNHVLGFAWVSLPLPLLLFLLKPSSTSMYRAAIISTICVAFFFQIAARSLTSFCQSHSFARGSDFSRRIVTCCVFSCFNSQWK